MTSVRSAYRRRKDTTAKGIVEGLEALGITVKESPTPATNYESGFPDAWIYYREDWFPMDWKSKGGKAGESQKKWWASIGKDPVLVRSIEEALRKIGFRWDDEQRELTAKAGRDHWINYQGDKPCSLHQIGRREGRRP